MPRSALVPFLLPILLAGCASTAGAASGRSLAAGAQATLAAGDTVTLPDASTLTYVGVASDSRCPPGVQCIQAGEAVVTFRHTDHGAAHEVQLRSGAATGTTTADLGRWRLALVSLTFDSPPKATVRLDPAG